MVSQAITNAQDNASELDYTNVVDHILRNPWPTYLYTLNLCGERGTASLRQDPARYIPSKIYRKAHGTNKSHARHCSQINEDVAAKLGWDAEATSQNSVAQHSGG